MFDTYGKIFDQRGEAYHRAMTLFPEARHREFQLAVDSLALRGGEVLCDIPAGGGYLVEHLPAELEIHLIAVDPSAAFARQWVGIEIESHLAPLNNLPIADDACDAVVSIAGLHHIEDRASVFAELRRVLRRDGRLCILEVASGSLVDPFLNDFVHTHNSMGHVGRFIDDDFRTDLEAAQFEIMRDELCHYTWEFADEVSMAEFVRLIFGLDKAEREDVLKAIADLLGYRRGDDGCHMNWEMQLLVATKE